MSGITDIEVLVRDFWATRPRRSVMHRKVGGVAAGIGHRYRIDPILVRVAFVVATLVSGVGLLLYLLGWLLLPAEDDEVSTVESLLGRGRNSMSPTLTVLLTLALVPAAGMVLGGHAFGAIGLAAAGAALFLLHRSRGALGEVPTPDGGPPQESTTRAASDQPTPPAWDPLGAAPFAWDLPEPAPAPSPTAPPGRRRRFKVTAITLGLALLAGGISSAFWPVLSLADIFAIMLAVVGLGLLIGSLVRDGRGLIAVAIPLALLTWVLQADAISVAQVTDQRWSPATAAQVTPHYNVTTGTGILDLSKVRMAEGETVATTAVVGIGDFRVVLPPNVDVRLFCRTYVGEVDCLRRSNSDFPAEREVRDSGFDGPGGGRLVLDAYAGIGNVTVERAQ